MDLTQVIGRASGLAGGAGAALLQRLQHVRLPGAGQASATDDPERAARRWRAVTVLRDPADVDPAAGGLPAPLAALGDRIEVRVTPAPGDRGTELAARYRHTPGPDEIGDLRAALREAKALLEVGEVLRVDPQPHGRRAATPQGAALEGAAQAAPREGVL